MKFEPFFKEVVGIGPIFLEKIIFETFFPVLFTCRDNKNELYLCLCFEIRGCQKWILSKVTKKIVTELLLNVVTIYEAFEMNGLEKIIIVLKDMTSEIESKNVLFSDIEELNLPDKDTYLESKDDFSDYINLINS